MATNPITANADPATYASYLDAAWGLKNYWYPALFSSELPADGVKGVEIGGTAILLRRAGGKVYALADQCVHRGVKLSTKPTCLTADTVSCWYHGFTYDLSDGKLVSIVAAPDDPLIGKVRLRTYAVQELKGIIFVFVGDLGHRPPPIADDLPIRPPMDEEHRAAHLLDDNVVVRGIHRTVNSNWRLAVENGFDPGHVLIHRDNILILASGRSMALGYRPVNDAAIKTFEGSGPKGLMNMYGSGNYEPVVKNERLNIQSAARGDFKFTGVRTSMFLPGVLMVENFPQAPVSQFEWYVPIDDKRHEYWQVLAAWCASPEEREAFEFRYTHYYEPVALRDFNDHDIQARQAMQNFYENGGWSNEALCSLDAVIVGWRQLVAHHARGIQKAPRS
jgi:nitrite reductase/ring-hydroxylating ferredoxin subunit